MNSIIRIRQGDGVLRRTHDTALNAASAMNDIYDDMDFAASSTTSVTEYHGNVIYHDAKVDMVLFPGGYATILGGIRYLFAENLSSLITLHCNF